MSGHVFAYGSLMFDPVWSRVVTRRYRSVAGRLRDHARRAVRDQDYPGLIARPGASTEGVVYVDVADDDVVRLDRFEGDDYRRIEVPVVTSDGRTLACGAYLYLPVDRLLDAPWRPEAFAMDRFLSTHCREWPAP